MNVQEPNYQINLNKAITYIEDHLDKKLLLKDIAREAHLSEFHFHRIFKALIGETVKDFVTRLKLERAANQLKYADSDIGQIAFQNGYENPESFSRAFKRYFQVSPKDYKSSIKEETYQRLAGFQKNHDRFSKLALAPPTFKTLPDLHLAYIRHTGSYAKVEKAFQRLMLWAASHLVLKLKPTTLGIVHDDPDLTEEDKIRFDACVLLTKPINPKNEIGYKTFKGGKYAVYRYRGAYDNFYEVYDFIYNKCLFEKKWDLADRPALEWYVKSPPFYKPDQYETDFYLPIQ